MRDPGKRCNESAGLNNKALKEIAKNAKSSDPNALIGPAGFGTQNYIQDSGNWTYAIDFENDGSVAAQDVTVTEKLDTSLDWSTFQLGSFGFGPITVSISAGLTEYKTTVAYTSTDGTSLNVQVAIDFNVQTGMLTATFTSLDPLTGAAPDGVFDGFLPPDNSNGIGEGFVAYTIKPKASNPTGTVINAQASIVFDTNAPISTNVFTNTIDAGPPTSSVHPLPPTTTATTFTVSWSGTDDPGGSGIASFTIYVSDNGGAFTPWLTNTTLTSAAFNGQVGHTYGFYSVAVDNVGNLQAMPTSAAFTTVTYMATHFSVSAPTATTAGSSFLFTVTALDQFNNIVTGYNGTVHFTSTDSRATAGNGLPTDMTFMNGTGVFLATLKTAGSQTLTATDTLTATIAGTSSGVAVSPAAAFHLAFGTQPSNTVTAQAITPAVTVQILDAFGNLETTDSTDAVTLSIFSGPAGGTFSAGSMTTATAHNGVATFGNLGFTTPGTYKLSEIVMGLYTGPVSNAFNVTPLQVSTFTQTSTGFTITFNQAIVPGAINLYDAFSTFGPADVTLVGAINGPIEGSLLINPTATSMTFVATNFGGLSEAATLAPDTYTVTLRSASNGFKDVNGGLLDGNNSLVPGTNYVKAFVVSASTLVVVTVPDFARGPGQPVNLPATGANGIPITIGDATGVTSVSFTLTYDPTLLTITGGSTSIGGATLTVDTSTPGTALVTFTSPALGGGDVTIGQLTATVPQTAPYQNKDLLHFSNVLVNGGAKASVGGDAIHVVAFFGDASGNELVDALDAALTIRAQGPDSGFAAYQDTDPLIIAGIDGGFSLDPTDVSQLLQFAVGKPAPLIPAVPTGFTIVQGGPDPTVSLPTNLSATAGGTVSVPVNIDDPAPAGSLGMVEATLALSYDPSVLAVSSSDIHLGSVPLSGAGWQLTSVVDAATGQISITLFSMTAITTQTGGSLVTLDFHVQPGAAVGAMPVSLVDAVSPTGSAVVRTGVADIQGSYTLSPPPSAMSNAGVAGLITVVGGSENGAEAASFVVAPGQDAVALAPADGTAPAQTYQQVVLGQFFGSMGQQAKDLISQLFGKALENQFSEALPLSLDAGLVMMDPDEADETVTKVLSDEAVAPANDLGAAERSLAAALDPLSRPHSAWADAFASDVGGSGGEDVRALDLFFASESGSSLTGPEDELN